MSEDDLKSSEEQNFNTYAALPEELIQTMKPVFEILTETSEAIKGVFDKANEVRRKRVERYGELTFYDAVRELAKDGYYFPPSLGINDIYELNHLKGKEREEWLIYIYEYEDKQLLIKDMVVITEFAIDGWSEVLEEMFFAIVKDEISYKAALPLCLSYAESLIRRLSVKKEKDKEKTSGKLIAQYIKELENKDSAQDVLEGTLVDVMKSLKRKGNMFSSHDFSSSKLPVTRHSVNHGALPPNKWQKIDFYKIVSWLAFVSMMVDD